MKHVSSIMNFIQQNISNIHYDSIAWTDTVIGDGINSVEHLQVLFCFVFTLHNHMQCFIFS